MSDDLMPFVIAALLVLLAVFCALWWRQRRQAQVLAESLAAASEQIQTGNYEPRTGLVSREAFERALDVATASCDREKRTLCVLFVDIDNFDSINQSLGHGAGDAVLHQYALRVKRTSPERSVAMRFGADQIIVVIEGDVEVGGDLAQRLVAELAKPFDAGPGHPVGVTVSVGVASYPMHGARTQLVACASTASRGVKQAGGNAYAVYDPKAVVDVNERAQMLSELRQAIAKGQLELFYQPKIDAKSLQITAAEALIRWRHPVRGIVGPGEFIPLAERHGLIGAMGNWVIDEACRQAGLWRRAGLRMRVAINLSAYQMRQDDFVDRLINALSKHELQPERFTVEITESLALENTQATKQTFERLRQAGLHVAIDDFGAGQTSIAYLRELPASELKLDISLVRDLEQSPEARTIAEALVNLAHALKRRVVAEGVETEAQRDLLVLMGCDELQGFLFARPMSAKALSLWAMDERPKPNQRFRASLFRETLQAPRA